MQTVYIGNTLVNDIFLGSKRMDDALQGKGSYTIEYLVVAGGGNGPSNILGQSATGGGGAGGLLSGSLIIKPYTTYQIKVGKGGGTYSSDNGEESYLTGSGIYVYSFGGGGGGKSSDGYNGGSGGGGGGDSSITYNGGIGVVGQGTNGGSNAGNNFGGPGGGLSVYSSITGTSIQYAVPGNGGGSGGTQPPANTGNGGHGAAANGGTSYNGATGIVVVRYLGTQRGLGGTVTTDGNYTIHKFTTTGNFTFYSN